MATNFTKNNISTIKLGEVEYNLKSVPFHATEVEWLSIDYIPKQGELIIYDTDETCNYVRFKTGDGVSQVSQLPFSLVNISEVQAYVNNQIGSAGHLKRVILAADEELPDIADADVDAIYMKLAYNSALAPDIYEEYMVINGAWEIIGNTKIDLTSYATVEFVETADETSISAHDTDSNAHQDIRESITKVLPTVTSENNGEFLRVSNGAWTACVVQSAEEVTF